MIATTVTYDYSKDAFSVVAYEVDEDVLRSAQDVERAHLEQLGELADVFETENGMDSVLSVESGEEADAWVEVLRLHRERSYVVVGPLGELGYVVTGAPD